MLATFFSSSCHHWILTFSLEASHFGHGWLRKKHLEPLCEVFNLLLNPTQKKNTQAPLNTSNNQCSPKKTKKKKSYKKRIETYRNTTILKKIHKHTTIEGMCNFIWFYFRPTNVPPNSFSNYTELRNSLILVCLPCVLGWWDVFSSFLHLLH